MENPIAEERKDNKSEIILPLSEAEIKLAIRELDIYKRELDVKQSHIEFNQAKKVSPVTASIVIGLLAAIGAMFGNWYQGRINTDLEQKKFESALILKAVEAKDKNEQMQKLKFLVDTGLISKDIIKSIDINDLPKSSSANSQEPAPILEGTWGIALETDFSLEDAQNNIFKMAKLNGYNNSYVFKRPEGYRTVAIFKTEKDAQEQISKAKTINPTVSEVKKIDEWCLKSQWNQELQYFDCSQ